MSTEWRNPANPVAWVSKCFFTSQSQRNFLDNMFFFSCHFCIPFFTCIVKPGQRVTVAVGTQMQLFMLYLGLDSLLVWKHHKLSTEFSYKSQEIQYFHFPNHNCWDFSTVSCHLTFYLDSEGSQLFLSCSAGKNLVIDPLPQLYIF